MTVDKLASMCISLNQIIRIFTTDFSGLKRDERFDDVYSAVGFVDRLALGERRLGCMDAG
jgi:hypothetical protein